MTLYPAPLGPYLLNRYLLKSQGGIFHLAKKPHLSQIKWRASADNYQTLPRVLD